MKASKKIMIAVALLIVALMIGAMVIIRDDVEQTLAKSALENSFKSIPVKKFDELDFSGRWSVKVKQGIEYKVELSVDVKSATGASVENRGGTLYLRADTDSIESKEMSYAKITTPLLKRIKATEGTEISINDFKSDTLSLEMENGSVFHGYGNRFKEMLVKTSGEVSIKMNEGEYE